MGVGLGVCVHVYVRVHVHVHVHVRACVYVSVCKEIKCNGWTFSHFLLSRNLPAKLYAGLKLCGDS